jgi:hypothetical protein
MLATRLPVEDGGEKRHYGREPTIGKLRAIKPEILGRHTIPIDDNFAEFFLDG